MTTNSPHPTVDAAGNNLFAAVDMGTNSFKLLIVRADPSTGRFLTLDQLKEPVLLGLDATAVISPTALNRAIAALRKFQQIIHSYRIPSSHYRIVATSAVREASNQAQFLHSIRQALNLRVDVLSGTDEARLIYLGVFQFHPVLNHTVLIVDIGGGSTEIVIGNNGNVFHAISLNLGHVILSKKFAETTDMRKHIQSVLETSGLIDKIKGYKIDKVMGSSSTIRAIEKAVYRGYTHNLRKSVGGTEKTTRDWRFNKEELGALVERLEKEMKERRKVFFKKRAEFIVAGAVLLDDIFKGTGIEEMEVSGHALGEGVITELLGRVIEGSYDLTANGRWMSVVRLATRFNSKKRMKSAGFCSVIAKEIFEGIRKWNKVDDEHIVYLEDQELEYLEAASLLHNIGLYAGRKGYHKQSYHLVMNGNHLEGYNTEEVKLVGLLVKHHKKKLPTSDHSSLLGFTEEVKFKFIVLCVILRLSIVLLQFLSANITTFEFVDSLEGFKLVLSGPRNLPLSSDLMKPLVGDHEVELDKELKHFRMVFQKKLTVIVPSST